jgi:hypothetical protein
MDITGFNEQIGKVSRPLKKVVAVKPSALRQRVQAAVKKAAPMATKMVAVKPSTLQRVQAAVKKAAPMATKMVAVKPSTLQRVQAAVKKAAPMPTKMVAVKPSVLQRVQQIPTSLPKKRMVVKATPIFSTDKKRVIPKRQVVTTQRVLPSVTRLRPQNQIMVVRSQPVTPQTMSVLNPIQRSFSKADLPYQRVVKSNPIVRLKNTPIRYSTSIDMIEPAVDAGTLNYYGK